MAIVYQHRREDTNEVFYIGIGETLKRAYQKKARMTGVMNAKVHMCEHCNITTNSGNYKRWHGINCKNKNK